MNIWFGLALGIAIGSPITAPTYETLVIKMDSAYKSRNIPRANNR